METEHKIEFTKAFPADIPLISKMIEKLYISENTAYDETKVNSALLELIEDESYGACWILTSGADRAGYMIIGSAFSVEFGGRTAFIDELYISENCRGKGLGRKALEFAENYAGEKGYTYLRLEVELSNTPAQKIYRANGFKEHERYIMTKKLKLDYRDD